MERREKEPGEIEVSPIGDGFRIEIEGGLEAIEIPDELVRDLLESTGSEEARELMRESIAEQKLSAEEAKKRKRSV